ncbi:hypothetical protein HYV82_01735 [Candidatus Woesearchaeota archaeon]|nr:hypothetical protein [Candidatus Woesearchaeota archaeon]
MSPEREIVNMWLNRKGFLTINSINAGSRVVDFVAVKQKKDAPYVMHVEVTCSISGNILVEKDRSELSRLFSDRNVVKAVEAAISESLGRPCSYEKVLVTNFHNINLEGVNIVKFEDVLFDVVNSLDKQRYRSQTVRTLQLIKYLLLSHPSRLSALLGMQSVHKSMTTPAREELIKELLMQETSKRVFRKQSNEQLLVELLRISSLKQPERLAKALEEILTKRSGSRLLNALMRQKGVKEVLKEELESDRKLEQFF